MADIICGRFGRPTKNQSLQKYDSCIIRPVTRLTPLNCIGWIIRLVIPLRKTGGYATAARHGSRESVNGTLGKDEIETTTIDMSRIALLTCRRGECYNFSIANIGITWRSSNNQPTAQIDVPSTYIIDKNVDTYRPRLSSTYNG